jgi:hypothetical protein
MRVYAPLQPGGAFDARMGNDGFRASRGPPVIGSADGLACASAPDPQPPVANVGYLEPKKIETFPHKSRLKLYGTTFQGTTLIYLREMHDLWSAFTRVIALSD